MIDKWREGYDVVIRGTARTARRHAVKRVTANGFYRLYQQDLATSHVPANAGDFRLMDRRSIRRCRLSAGADPLQRRGCFPASVPDRPRSTMREQRPSLLGTTKWRYWKLWNFALDGLTASPARTAPDLELSRRPDRRSTAVLYAPPISSSRLLFFHGSTCRAMPR